MRLRDGVGAKGRSGTGAGRAEQVECGWESINDGASVAGVGGGRRDCFALRWLYRSLSKA